MSILVHAQLRHEAGLRVTDVVPHPILPAETVEVYADTPTVLVAADGYVACDRGVGTLPETTADGRPVTAPCPACGAHIARVDAYVWWRHTVSDGIYSITPLPIALCVQLHPCGHVVSGWGYTIGSRPDA